MFAEFFGHGSTATIVETLGDARGTRRECLLDHGLEVPLIQVQVGLPVFSQDAVEVSLHDTPCLLATVEG